MRYAKKFVYSCVFVSLSQWLGYGFLVVISFFSTMQFCLFWDASLLSLGILTCICWNLLRYVGILSLYH